jgi:hypothetical protein
MKYDEFIRIEQLDSTLTSVVFLGDNQSEQPLGISGSIYYRNEFKQFDMKATCFNEVTDVDEVV